MTGSLPINSGIRPTHVDFGGRASIAADFVGDGMGGNDCNGHGTRVAGTIGGNSFGVAKGVSLHAVRDFDCAGKGATSNVIAPVGGLVFLTKLGVSRCIIRLVLPSFHPQS